MMDNGTTDGQPLTFARAAMLMATDERFPLSERSRVRLCRAAYGRVSLSPEEIDVLIAWAERHDRVLAEGLRQ